MQPVFRCAPRASAIAALVTCLGLAPAAALGSFTVTLTSPTEGQRVDSGFSVVYQHGSAFDIDEATLTFNGVTRAFTHGEWIDTSQLAFGTYPLSIVLRDHAGDTGTAQTSVRVDRAPVLVVRSPHPWAVARPDVSLDAECSDDSGATCLIMVYASYVCGSGPNGGDIYCLGRVASGPSPLAQPVDLTRSDGNSWVALSITASVAGSDAMSELALPVVVDRNPRLVAVSAWPGLLLDFDGVRALTSEVLCPSPSECVGTGANALTRTWKGALTETGGVLSFSGPTIYADPGDTYFVSTDGGVVVQEDAFFLSAGGRHAVLSQGGLFALDVDGGTSTSPPRDGGTSFAGPVLAQLYPAGEDNWQLSRFEDGVEKQVALIESDGSYYGIPRLVADNATLGVVTRAVTGMIETLEIYRTGGLVARVSAMRGWPVELNGEWMAFYQSHSGETSPRIHRLSPEGVESQASYFTAETRLDALGPDGTVVATADARTYLLYPDGGTDIIGDRIAGRVRYVDGGLYVLAGDTLFAVDLTLAREPLLQSAVVPADGAPDCGCQSSGGASLGGVILALSAIACRRRTRR